MDMRAMTDNKVRAFTPVSVKQSALTQALYCHQLLITIPFDGANVLGPEWIVDERIRNCLFALSRSYPNRLLCTWNKATPTNLDRDLNRRVMKEYIYQP